MGDVIVVGSGPAGMMLAGELALAGVDVSVLERRPTPELAGSRAGGFHARTIEVLDQRGIADRFLAAGHAVQTARFAGTVLDVSGFPTRHPYGLALWQNQIEPILADWIRGLGVRVDYGREVVGLTQDGDGVEVAFADGATARTEYLVGADGGRSAIRKAAGIAFPGWEATRSNLIAEVEVAEEPPSGVRQDEYGVHGLSPLGDGRTYRVVTTERRLGPSTEPSLADLSEALVAVFGSDFGIHDPVWISRFTDATRQAEAYRSGRALLVGDAAHIHYPAGGQGVGLGIQDAVNLGWKLGQVVRGVSADSLLDSYHAERHPVGASVLQLSMALTALQRNDPRTTAVGAIVDDVLTVEAARDRLAARVHGLDIAYDLGGRHPLVGRRMPDLDLVVDDRATRVSELLHEARWVLLRDGSATGRSLPRRVRSVSAQMPPTWDIPVLGTVPAQPAVLIRPDGHVAWVHDGFEPIEDALVRYFRTEAAG